MKFAIRSPHPDAVSLKGALAITSISAKIPRGARAIRDFLDPFFPFIEAVGEANVGVLLDAYHMNIEESEPAAALRLAGDKLWLYHVADSNRQGVGRGHTDFRAQMTALADIGYDGPIIVECTAPGPDPFTAIKDEESLGWLERYLQESLHWLRKTLA